MFSNLRKALILLCFSVFLGSCALFNPNLAPLIEQLKADKADVCLQIGGGAGTGAVIPGPGIPIGGGYGYVWFGRVGKEGSKIILNKDGCTIENTEKAAVNP